MVELELEKTYLAKALPDLAGCRSEIIRDVYVPESADHAILRIRQRGKRYEATKKIPVSDTDSSRQNEHTIPLDRAEFEALSKCSNKSAVKRRYYCQIEGRDAEVDLYQEDLTGLITVDFEFADQASLQSFQMPSICLADVTQKVTFAGGSLAGKNYNDISRTLDVFDYKLIETKELV
jgi:adenylate cyclase